MTLMTPEEYENSLKKIDPLVFIDGEKVKDIRENKNIRTVIEANKSSYEWALDPEYQDIMTTQSPLIDEKINRYTHVSASIDDLVKKARAGKFAAEKLGTCIYRCVGLDALHSLASTTWEMDKRLDTNYHQRFLDYLKMIQENDLTIAGALTEPRGQRDEKTLEWSDPFLSLKIIDESEEGILVKGSKVNISGAFASHEVLVLPQKAHSEEEEDYSVAFATPTDADGITFVCEYGPYAAERDTVEKLEELGNPLYGQRMTSMIVFDEVFVPWERVFHFREPKYSRKLVARFARTHRMTCGGTCKVGFMNLIIGASKLAQEYKGMENVQHINEELTEMSVLKETVRACGLRAAREGSEVPEGSGVFLPDEVMGNVAKLNVCNAFWRVMALAGDIGGGAIVNLPSLRELENPEVKNHIKEFFSFGSEEPTENILKIYKYLQHWTAGQHGVATWHGAGPPQTQKVTIERTIDYERAKELVREALDISEKDQEK